ncbi:MAG: polyprenyl diphosphate synthase [Patescibacteria group bacterium]|jgi:undecaprenyl diphosphate synthase
MQTKVKHLAIVMDGNRRWAKKKGYPTYKGHQAGVQALENIVRACNERDIPYLTVYGFSTENWGRTKSEVSWLIKIIAAAVKKYTVMLDREGWRLQVIGRLKDFPKSTQSLFDKSINQLKNHQKGMLTIALSYGGRDEILRAIEKAKKQSGKLTEKGFSALLDTRELPDPDMIIRTGNQMRLSNFLPWQGTYSELYFTPTLWPDFNAKSLDQALQEYSRRQRNFGK